jgi:uncharacterized protein (DUF427 family)/membrane-associated phospholipid phosphatase
LLGGGARAARILLVACVIVLAALGAWVAHKTQPGALDGWIDSRIQARLTRHYRFTTFTKDIGDPLRVTIICAVLVVACVLTRRYRGAALVAIAVPLAGAFTEFALKPLFDRTITGALAYPSGHLTGISAMAAAGIVLLFGPSRPRLPALVRWLTLGGILLVVVAMALALVAGFYHYFTDTIGGAAVGTGTVLATALALDWLCPQLGPRWSRWLGPRWNQRGRAVVGTSMTSGHKITITPSDAHIEVSLGGVKLADSRRASVLAETGLPPRYYLPRADVRADLLQPTSTRTTCPFKGDASYWSAEVGGEVHEDVVWSYESPIAAAADIAGLLCFYTERVELTVDGERQQGATAPASH